ncbi:MAG: MerR family transcriptional regulator [Sarcina sp.]
MKKLHQHLLVHQLNLDRREYSNEDIEWILFIKKLKDTGMILSEIKRYSDFRYLGDITIEKRKNMLMIHRKTVEKEILKWNSYLDNIDKKIEIYNGKLK